MSQTDMNLILPDIPRLYTALAEWLACIVCILEMKRRIRGGKLILLQPERLYCRPLF